MIMPYIDAYLLFVMYQMMKHRKLWIFSTQIGSTLSKTEELDFNLFEYLIKDNVILMQMEILMFPINVGNSHWYWLWQDLKIRVLNILIR